MGMNTEPQRHVERFVYNIEHETKYGRELRR